MNLAGTALWVAAQAFGRDAVERVLGEADVDAARVLSDEEVRKIASASEAKFLVDPDAVWVAEIHRARGAKTRVLGAAEALEAFGIELLCAARERGGVPVAKA